MLNKPGLCKVILHTLPLSDPVHTKKRQGCVKELHILVFIITDILVFQIFRIFQSSDIGSMDKHCR